MPAKPAPPLAVTSRRPPLVRLIALAAIVILGLYIIIQPSTQSTPIPPSTSVSLAQSHSDVYASFTEDYAILQQNAVLAAQEVKKELAEAKQRAVDAKIEAEKARQRARNVKQNNFNALREKEKERRRKNGKGDAQADYSFTVVLGRLKEEESATNWTKALYGVDRLAEYIVDDPTAPLSLKENKGREAMVYMQYIINHWDNLTDVTAFVHSGNLAWHNNVLLSADLVPTINRLRRHHVVEKGYFNTRCELWPGCPRWIKFDADKKTQNEFVDRALDTYTPKMWNELFPGEPIPNYLSEPCCSQFAVSRAAIHVNKKVTYERIRDYLSSQDLEQFSGRQMEYIWQYLFTGDEELCPSMKQCYCDGYGICMDDDADLLAYNLARKQDDEGWRNFNNGGAQIKNKAQKLQSKLARLLPERLGWKSPFAKMEWPGDTAEWFGFDIKQGGWDVDEEEGAAATTATPTSTQAQAPAESQTDDSSLPPEAALTKALSEVKSTDLPEPETQTETETQIDTSVTATATATETAMTDPTSTEDEKPSNVPDPTEAEQAMTAQQTDASDPAALLLQGAENAQAEQALDAAKPDAAAGQNALAKREIASGDAFPIEHFFPVDHHIAMRRDVATKGREKEKGKEKEEQVIRHDPGWNQASVNYFGNQQLGQNPDAPGVDLRIGASYRLVRT